MIDRKAFDIGYRKGWDDAVYVLLGPEPEFFSPGPDLMDESYEETK